MTHNEIMATDRKIAYVDNVGGATKEFHDSIIAAVHSDSEELPEELSDLLKLSYVNIGNERRAIINWA